MKRIVLASDNRHKIKEFREILADYEILALKDVGFNDEIVEDGKTFLENALIKAKAVKVFLDNKNIDAYIIADDSGLCVNSLNGEPGIYSARYAGEHGNNDANRKKLLDNLRDKEDRSAYFNCTLVLLKNDGSYDHFDGKTYGEILTAEEGNRDFCFDCLFYSSDLKKSFGVATAEEKNSVSHRARAIEQLKKYLQNDEKF